MSDVVVVGSLNMDLVGDLPVSDVPSARRAAQAVTRFGAQTSLPTLAKVEALLGS